MDRQENNTFNLISGMGMGAGLMYFFDPRSGRRRRALVKDRAISTVHRSEDAMDTTSRNLRDRGKGLLAEMKAQIMGEGEVSDEILVDRIRSRIGRVVSHPHAIQVSARSGRVTLSGPVLGHELKALVSCVESVRRVKEVENRLEPHREADVPGLQGGVARPGERWEVLQTNWPPSLRFLMGAGGMGLAVYGMQRRGPVGRLSAAVGAVVLARAATNLELKRLFGIGAGLRAVDIHKTININAPVEEVFEFWRKFENFPKFMPHLKDVRTTAEGRNRWTAAGPGNLHLEWSTVVTQFEPNKVIAWRSDPPGSGLQNAGIVHFQPNRSGGTQIDITMSYNSPGGALGRSIAAILGADPGTAMHEDLVRFKSLMETGKATASGRTVTREELGTT